MSKTVYHSLMSYLSEEQIQNVLQFHKSSIESFAYIHHDKEDNVNHYHIILKLFTNWETENVRKWFTVPFVGINTFNEEIISPLQMFKYLTHTDDKSLNDDSKFKYSEDNIVSDNLTFWKSRKDKEKSIKTIQLLYDIIERKPLSYMVATYGRDFVLNYSKYIDFAERLYADDKYHEESPREWLKPIREEEAPIQLDLL